MAGVNAIREERAGMGNAHLPAKETPDARRVLGMFPAHETGQHKDKKDYIGDEGGENADLAKVRLRDYAGAHPDRT
jgi:hypothetical protein